MNRRSGRRQSWRGVGEEGRGAEDGREAAGRSTHAALLVLWLRRDARAALCVFLLQAMELLRLMSALPPSAIGDALGDADSDMQRPASSTAQALLGASKCVACLERRSTMAVYPRGHRCLCAKDAPPFVDLPRTGDRRSCHLRHVIQRAPFFLGNSGHVTARPASGCSAGTAAPPPLKLAVGLL
jgi:hypothetical protein